MPCHAMTWQAPDMYSMRAMPCNITGHDKPCSPWMPYHERPSKTPHLMTYLSKPPPHPASKKFWHHFLQISSLSYVCVKGCSGTISNIIVKQTLEIHIKKHQKNIVKISPPHRPTLQKKEVSRDRLSRDLLIAWVISHTHAHLKRQSLAFAP